MTRYPRRPSYFAHQFTRLLFKSCAAQSIGLDAVALLTLIVHTEDSRRYTGPVTFHTGQLVPLLGWKKWDQLDRARRRAVAAGWLHYDPPPSGSRAPAAYWVTIPTEFAEVDDSPVDEGLSADQVTYQRGYRDGYQDGSRALGKPSSVPRKRGAPVPTTPESQGASTMTAPEFGCDEAGSAPDYGEGPFQSTPKNGDGRGDATGDACGDLPTLALPLSLHAEAAPHAPGHDAEAKSRSSRSSRIEAQPAIADEAFQRDWNAIGGVEQCRCITERRRKALAARCRDPTWVDNLSAALARVAASGFCRGKGERGWRASVDWFLRPDTLTQVLEGKFDDRRPANGTPPGSISSGRVRQRDWTALYEGPQSAALATDDPRAAAAGSEP